MPVGAPDFSNVRHNAFTHLLFDLSELAARLGSIVNLNRSGQVIFQDTFNQSLNLYYQTSIVGTPSVSLDNQYGYQYANSLRIDTVTATHGLYLNKFIPYLNFGNVGYEIKFSQSSTASMIYFALTVQDGVSNVNFIFRYDGNVKFLQYLDANGNFQNLVNLNTMLYSAERFHHIKFVVNQNKSEYVYVLFDYQLYSLVNLKGFRVGGTANKAMVASLGSFALLDGARSVLFDDLIITMNET